MLTRSQTLNNALIAYTNALMQRETDEYDLKFVVRNILDYHFVIMPYDSFCENKKTEQSIKYNNMKCFFLLNGYIPKNAEDINKADVKEQRKWYINDIRSMCPY